LTVIVNINTVIGEYGENVVGDALGIQPVSWLVGLVWLVWFGWLVGCLFSSIK